MTDLNKKENELLIQWVKSGKPDCRITKYLSGADYSFGGTSTRIPTDFECLEYDAMIDKFREHGFISYAGSGIGTKNYTLTYNAVEYVKGLS